MIKTIDNQQHRRVLSNEWLASSIAMACGLSVPPFGPVYLSAEFVKNSPRLLMRRGGVSVAVAPGVAFGSRFVSNASGELRSVNVAGRTDGHIVNIGEFAGIMVIDKWLCNCDNRQVIYAPAGRGTGRRALFIDHGFVFNAGDWNFPDSPLRGLYRNYQVYSNIRGWADLDGWLQKVEAFPRSSLGSIAMAMPREWREGEIWSVLEQLLRRRGKVRGLINESRLASTHLFPNWRMPVATAIAPSIRAAAVA